MKRNYGNCLDCEKSLGDYYSIRCKTCANKITAAKKIGTHLSEETKAKIAKSVKEYSKNNLDKLTFKKGHKINTGRTYGEERNLKIRGENSPHWKGGVTPENVKIRSSQPYKLWRKAVFERDNYTCVECAEKGCTLNADHIKPFAFFPELRLEVSNGRTLCVPCHEKTATYKKKKYA